MADLAQKMQRVRSKLVPAWTDERAEAALRGAHAKSIARARRNALAGVAGVVVLVLGVFFAVRPSNPTTPMTKDTLPSIARLTDGSKIATVGVDTRIEWREITSSNVVLAVEHGRVQCDVTANPGRTFRVEAGPVLVEVLGTAFDVDRRGGVVTVSVSRGLVRVTSPTKSRELHPGEIDTFSTVTVVPPPPTVLPSPVEATHEPARSTKRLEPDASATAWRALAQRGDFDEAWADLLKHGKASVVNDDAQDLLLFADVARNSGHAVEALEPLQRITRSHRGDGHASLAAFTLGRVLLDELGRPADAALAFADARALGSALAEDALAREVEAWSRAGETEKAKTLAKEYLDRYPYGSRTRLVRRHGGLE